ncbi:MAG: NAD(P)/FAD-dependent oxidoreductase [Candidatus Saccharimonadales bacterium]
MSKHKIIIIGGGFGGVKAALRLSEDTRFHITLISDHLDFRYYPSLFHTATGGSKSVSSISLTEIFSGKRVHILQDLVTDVDKINRTIKTKAKHTLSYDALIVGIGVTTNYFHIQGLEDNSYGIKTLSDAEELKHHLHQQILDTRKLDLNYVVIGGGPTGIELAGALPHYLKKISESHNLHVKNIHIDLVEAAPRLLPRMPKDVSRKIKRQLKSIGVKLYLKTTVKGLNAESLLINNKNIRSHTVIWTAGVANNFFFREQGFQLASNGKVRVDQYLQSNPAIYVIGDNADTPYSGMAQTALRDGKYVAENIIRIANKKDPLPYRAKKPIYVFPAGDKWAAVVWGPARIYGLLGWVLRRAADLIAYHDYEPWKLASHHWLDENTEESDCLTCAQIVS